MCIRKLAVLRDLKSEQRVSMERYADELVLLARNQPGWNVQDYVLDEPGIPEVASRFSKIRRYKRRYVDYPKYVAQLDADVFHIADHAFASLIRKMPPQRTVITCHDLIPLTQHEWSGKTVWSPTLPLLRYSLSYLKQAAKVIADCDKTKYDLLALGLAKDDRIVVIPPPVSPVFSAQWKDQRDVTRIRFNLSKDDVVLLHVSSPNTYKNIETVVDVVAELRRRNIPAVLVRIGRKLHSSFIQRAEDLGVEQWIRQLGYIEDVEVARLYGAADVLIFPSLKEGFGWPVVEAMASGLPVVASNVEAITQSLAGTGIQADAMDIKSLANGVELISVNDEMRRKLTHMALERSRVYSRDAVGRSIREIYESVSEDARRNPGVAESSELSSSLNTGTLT